MQTFLGQIGERIRYARLSRKMTQTDIARRVERSKQLVSAWEVGRSEITVFCLAKLASSLDIDLNWLVSGKVSPHTTHVSVATPDVGRLALVKRHHDLHDVMYPEDIKVFGSYTHRPCQLADHCFAIEVRDDGMAPAFCRGDLVYVDPRARIEPGSIVAALVKKQNDQLIDGPLLVVRNILSTSTDCTAPPFTLVASSTGFRSIDARSNNEIVVFGRAVGCMNRQSHTTHPDDYRTSRTQGLVG